MISGRRSVPARSAGSDSTREAIPNPDCGYRASGAGDAYGIGSSRWPAVPSASLPTSRLRPRRRLGLAPGQVVPQVRLERRQPLLRPRGFDGLGDLLVFFHYQAEGLVLGVFGGWEPVAVVGVGAEEVGAGVGAALHGQLHVGVLAVAQADGEPAVRVLLVGGDGRGAEEVALP